MRYLTAITQFSLTLTESHDANVLLALVSLLLPDFVLRGFPSVWQRRTSTNVEERKHVRISTRLADPGNLLGRDVEGFCPWVSAPGSPCHTKRIKVCFWFIIFT